MHGRVQGGGGLLTAVCGRRDGGLESASPLQGLAKRGGKIPLALGGAVFGIRVRERGFALRTIFARNRAAFPAGGIKLHGGKSLRDFAIGHAEFAHEAVVGIFAEAFGNAACRLVDEHEDRMPREKGDRQHRAGEERRRLGALGLSPEALARAVVAGPSGVQRREAPLRHHERPPAFGVDVAEKGGDGLAALGVEHRPLVDVCPRIDVHRHDVAVFAGNLPDDAVHVAEGPHEAASEDHVVRVGVADRAAERRKVFFGEKPQKAFSGKGRELRPRTPGGGRRDGLLQNSLRPRKTGIFPRVNGLCVSASLR